MLHRSSLAESQVGGKFDAIFSVSTIEHMSEVTLTETLSRLKGLLAPGGRIVLTVDLFLNLKPFSMRETNQWGTNVSPKWIEDQLGMTLVEGDRSELYGYPEFSCQNILAHLEDYATRQLSAIGTTDGVCERDEVKRRFVTWNQQPGNFPR